MRTVASQLDSPSTDPHAYRITSAMSFQSPISIADAVAKIRQHRLLLPAIQREFVWGAKQVEWLFDSLLQGYPFGSFLFWQVQDASAKADFRYYEFLRDYRERYRQHNPEFNTVGHTDFDAVLDGQQRLTSIYIGLTGTYAYKLPRVWWENSERAIPTRKLYLNVSGPAEEDEEEETGRRYEFKFLTTSEVQSRPEKWFLIGDILEVISVFQFNQMLKQKGYQDNEFTTEALSTLHNVVHTDRLINYYQIQKSDMERALNVFVRVNSGGEPLSLSDMLMSTAIANWQRHDARKEILGLVDRIQDYGFYIGKDLILKACLYLYSSDIRYRVSNFSAAQVRPFDDAWEQIRDTLVAVFTLIREYGFNEKTLTSKNALLPIVYWVHHRNLADRLVQSVDLRDERDRMRRWLHTVLIKGVFGASADTVLAAIRRCFTGKALGDPYVDPSIGEFPVEAISAALQSLGKDPRITDEYIDVLLSTEYEEKQAFSLLALLSPQLDYRNGDFHKDHLHPKSMFSSKKLRALGVLEADLEFYLDTGHWNSILNLRHLDSNENKSKLARPLAEWAADEARRQGVSLDKFCLDRDLPRESGALDLLRFREFIEARRYLLRHRLRDALQ